MSDQDIPTETLAESEHYVIWASEEPDGETVYHVDMGPVTLHFFQEEWEELLRVIKQATG